MLLVGKGGAVGCGRKKRDRRKGGGAVDRGEGMRNVEGDGERRIRGVIEVRGYKFCEKNYDYKE